MKFVLWTHYDTVVLTYLLLVADGAWLSSVLIR